MEEKKELPEAKGLCSECIKTYQRYQEKFIYTYCKHNSSGGIFYLENQAWHINTPVSLEQHEKTVDGLIQAEKAYETYHGEHTDETFH